MPKKTSTGGSRTRSSSSVSKGVKRLGTATGVKAFAGGARGVQDGKRWVSPTIAGRTKAANVRRMKGR